MSHTQGNGASIVFGTTSFSGNIVSMNQDGVTRDDIDITHLGTTVAKDYDPAGLYEGGTYALVVQFDPETVTTVPYNSSKETVTLSYAISNSSNATKGTAAFTAYINSFDFNLEVNTLSLANITLKVASSITYVNETT